MSQAHLAGLAWLGPRKEVMKLNNFIEELTGSSDLPPQSTDQPAQTSRPKPFELST